MRQRFFALTTLCLSIGISLYAAEWILAYQRQSIAHSDRLQPGMIEYDSRLGWRLKPNWFGSHQHHDFEVDYSINRFGFRGRQPSQSGARRYAVVGDSFSFGQGVDEGQTFASLLDESLDGAEFLNFSVPGYSTDQQLLMIRDRVRLFRPDVLLLVAYLGNDLFDNARPFPLQGDHAKPFFHLHANGRLELRNSPVPVDSRPAAARTDSLTSLVLGESRPQRTLLQRWLGGLEIARRLGLFQPTHESGDAGFEARFAYHLELFQALVGEIADSTKEWGADLKLVLLPGRSLVEQPRSLSAGYQDFLRRALLREYSAQGGVEIIDLAAALRDAREEGVTGLYYPNEGHLSPAGHAQVAGVLSDHLRGNR